MSETARSIYTFGPFRVDEVRRLLLRDDQTVPLTAKAFDILLVLLEEKGPRCREGRDNASGLA